MNQDKRQSMVFIVNSCSYDKTLSAFMLANSVLDMGIDVHIYFSFMGVNIIKKGYKPRLPGMFRFVTGVYKKRLKKANVESLERQIAKAQNQGAKMYVCSMCIESGLLKKEKIMEGVEIAGFATLVDLIADSDCHIFIG